MKSQLAKLVLLSIFVLAGILRLVNLADVPPGLNRDEAAIGYTAYSLLKTGRDEHGQLWPLSLKSFGDWKLPAYVYVTIPSVAIFDLDEFAVRLPAVIFGTLLVGLIYFIALELFHHQTLAILASFLLAVSPWQVFFSRVVSEANMAVFLVSLAFYAYLKSTRGAYLAVIGTLLLVLTLLTYHGNHVFTPLIFIAFGVFFKKTFFGKWGALCIGLFAVLTLVIFSHTFFSADTVKISGLLSINDPSLVYEHVVENRLIYSNSLLSKIFNNKVIFLLENIVHNYLKSYSAEFLFIKGGNNAQHNIPDFGNLYLVEAPFLLLGLYFLFANKEKAAPILLTWMLLAPLGAALTKDAPHSARQLAVFPAITLVTAYGMFSLLAALKKTNGKLLMALFIVLFIGNISLFLNRYFVIFPYKSTAVWGKGYKELVEKIAKYKHSYTQVLVSRPEYSPYIYYLFYRKSDPSYVQRTMERYPATAEGFEHVKAFDGVLYQKNDWTEELLIPDRLYVDWVEGIPTGATNSAVVITKSELVRLKPYQSDIQQIKLGTLVSCRLVDRVVLPNNSPLFYLIETRTSTP